MDSIEYLESIPQDFREEPLKLSPRGKTWEGDITGIFHIDQTSCDVVLSDTRITWTPLKDVKKSKKKKSKKAYTDTVKEDGASFFLLLKDIFCVKIKRRRKPEQKEGEGVCLGVSLYTFERKDANKLRERNIVLEHPSEDVCSKMALRIDQVITGYNQRPKRLKIFLQPYAGTKKTRTIYKDKVLPILNLAKVKANLTDIAHNEQVKQEMLHLDLRAYDCIVAMGGDGTVNQVVNGLLSRSQVTEGVDMKPGCTPVKASLPLGILPCGTTNHVAHSVMGVDDVVTAIIHIVFGHCQAVDCLSVYNKDKFYKWAFNCQYGFVGNVLSLTDRYSILGQKKGEAAILKALTKSKLRPYECELQYIPSPNAPQSHAKDGVVCRTGCDVCMSATPGMSRQSSVYSDSLQEYDPLAISGTSSTIIDLTKENPWRTTKGVYLNVALFSVPGRCEWAPQGLSKYTHLADGCLDLVLVRNVDRKEFLRYLKRHGNSKNQMDLPFVEVYRVKDVQFRPRFHTTWKHSDQAYNEINYEINRAHSRLATINERSLDVVNDLSLHSDDDLDDDIKEVDDDYFDDGDDSDDTHRPKSGSEASKPNSESASLAETNSNDPREQDKNVRSSYSAPVPGYRMTEYEKDIARRKKKQKEKQEKEKRREESKTRSVWSVDNELCSELELDFRVHPHLITVFAEGVSPFTEPEENRLGCIPRF